MWKLYVTRIRQEVNSEKLEDIYVRLNEALENEKTVIIIEKEPIGRLLEKWIKTGQYVKHVATALCLSSYLFNRIQWYQTSFAVSFGGLALQMVHSSVWERDRISKYVVQTFNVKPINEEEKIPEHTVLVRKPKTGLFLVRTALTLSAVAVSSYFLWKTMT